MTENEEALVSLALSWSWVTCVHSVVVLCYLYSLCRRLVLLVLTLSSSCVTCVNSVVVLGYLCSLAITVHREMQLGHCPQTQVRACETCSLFS